MRMKKDKDDHDATGKEKDDFRVKMTTTAESETNMNKKYATFEAPTAAANGYEYATPAAAASTVVVSKGTPQSTAKATWNATNSTPHEAATGIATTTATALNSNATNATNQPQNPNNQTTTTTANNVI